MRWFVILLFGCGHAPMRSAKKQPDSAAYQSRWGGLSVRKGDEIVDAPAADQELAKTYPQWPDKGGVSDGVALTLMTAKTTYAVDEEVRVIHVLDVSVTGRGVYVMGPKVPNDEFVDGVRATPLPEIATYPYVGTYDGVVLPSPGVDYNYDVTSYRFKAGKHTIEWRLGGLQSNAIAIDVR